MEQITPEMVLRAYCMGVFPMAKARHAKDIGWYDPQLRGVLPISGLHVPKRLAKTVRQQPYRMTYDADFRGVITACADVREDTWINDEIISLYTVLHDKGFAHSVEAWDGDVLAGGVYGISIGGAFFGESMFSVRRDASKIALVYLAARLWRQGFTLLDTQFVNEHLVQFGVEEIPRAEYHRRLAAALDIDASFEKNQLSGAPDSKDPGSCSSAGTAGLSAEGLGAGSGAATPPVPEEVSGAGASSSDCSGFSSGAFSSENSSEDFLDVLAFLHSITQTS